MAGNGFLPNECNELIIQLDKLRARSETSMARLSGISEKRLDDKSRICSVLARGERPLEAMVVKELSARLR
jgi:hypothetical protein